MEIETNGNYFIIPNGRQQIPLSINVSGSTSNVQASKDVSITSNGTTTVSPDEGYDSIAHVNVTTNVPASTNVTAVTMKWNFSNGNSGSTQIANNIQIGNGSSVSVPADSIYISPPSSNGQDIYSSDGSNTRDPTGEYVVFRNIYGTVRFVDSNDVEIFRIGNGNSIRVGPNIRFGGFTYN